MLDAQETEIDGTVFRYQPMMLKKSRGMFAQLSQRFGPAIASAVEGLGDADLSPDMEITQALGTITQSAGGLLRGVVGALDPAYHEKLANELAAQTQYQKEAGGFVPLDNSTREVMFGANLLTEYKLIVWCLGIQYSDFLAPLRGLGQQALALRGMAGSVSKSPEGLTGLSTE